MRLQVRQLLAQRLQPLLARLVLLLLEGRLLDLELHHPPGGLVEVGGHGVDLGPDHGAGLVDQVDPLVGQEAVGDVAVREDRGRHQGVVLDLHSVVHLEALAQTAQDRDRVLDRRRVDHHRLEAPLERSVFFDVLPILVERGGSQAVQLAPRQHRLEQIAGVGRALRAPGAHDVVNLVDEQEHPALALLDLVQHRLEALFELAAVLGAGEQRAHVEREDRSVLEPLGHVAAHDPLGEPLDDRRLADAGLADQHRVVLGLARQDAHDAADLGVAADHRIEPASARLLDEIDSVLVERLVGLFRRRAGHALAAAHGAQRFEESISIDAGLAQQSPGGGARAFGEERQQEMLDRHVLVLQPLGFLFGRDERLLEPLGDVDLAGLAAARDARAAAQLAAHAVGEGRRLDVHPGEQPRHEAGGVVEQGEQQVLAVDFLVAVLHGDRLGRLHGFLRFLGQFVLVHRRSINAADRSPRLPRVVRRAGAGGRRASRAPSPGSPPGGRRSCRYRPGTPCRAAGSCDPTTSRGGSST